MAASRSSLSTMIVSSLQLCYIALFMFSPYTLAAPSNKPAPCDEVPCIAGCLSDSWATAPSSCTSDPAKSNEVECLCATVSSVTPKAGFAGCFMTCSSAEREKLREFCGVKHNTSNDKKAGSGSRNHNKGFNTGASVDDNGINDEEDFDEEEEEFDETTTDDSHTWDDDDDENEIKTPDQVEWDNTSTEEEDEDEDDDGVTIGGVKRIKKGDASSLRLSAWWTTLGAVGAAAIVML